MYKKMIALIATIGILLGIVFGLSLYIRNIKRGNLEKSKIQQIDEVAEQLVEDDCTDEWQYLASLYKEEIIANSSESKVSPNCIIEKRIKYNDCGHEIIQRMDVPLELINKTQDDVQKEYEGWHIEKFSEKQIVLIREIDNECGEHFVLKSEDGKITIYKRESDGEKLYLKTEICTDYLPETDKIKIQEGMEINTKDELNKILEDYE